MIIFEGWRVAYVEDRVEQKKKGDQGIYNDGSNMLRKDRWIKLMSIDQKKCRLKLRCIEAVQKNLYKLFYTKKAKLG